MILVLGDSYVFDDSANSYIGMLKDLLKVEIRSFGIPGASFWAVRRKLLEMLKNIDKNLVQAVIIVHPHYQRMPNKDDRSLAANSLKTLLNANKLSNTLATTIINYYEYFYDRDNFLWQLEKWIKELNSEIFNENTHIINLHGHSNSFVAFEPFYGTNSTHVLSCLYAIQYAEFNNQDEYENHYGHDNSDARLNHFSYENNKAMAEELYNIIVEKKIGPYKLNLDKFVFKNLDFFIQQNLVSY
jgi:hypothetical protein